MEPPPSFADTCLPLQNLETLCEDFQQECRHHACESTPRVPAGALGKGNWPGDLVLLDGFRAILFPLLTSVSPYVNGDSNPFLKSGQDDNGFMALAHCRCSEGFSF